MGGNQSDLSTFQPQPYLKSGLNLEEILMLKTVFDQQEPEDGRIQSSRLRELYQDSYDRKVYDAQIGSRETLTFDEFFDIMSADLLNKKRQFGDIQFDSQGLDIGCAFCPTSINTTAGRA